MPLGDPYGTCAVSKSVSKKWQGKEMKENFKNISGHNTERR